MKLAVSDGKLWTVKVSADGYKDLTVKITKETVNYTDTYKAEVVSNSGETTNKRYTADVTPAVNGKITLSAAKDIKEGDTVTVTATPDENYEVVAVTVKGVSGKSVDVQNAEGIYTFKMPAENVIVSATFKEKAIAGNKKIEVSQVSINKDLWGSDWEFTFKNAEDYVSAITDVKVNGTSWEEKSYSVSSGGQYYKNTSSNKLVCAAREYSANPTIPVLKSGDIITITANGYEDLTFKLVIKDGNASLVEDDGQGDPYDLHVKIDGSFEASATSGQIASLITDTEGSSAVLKGAFVTYCNEAKIMQGVPAEVLDTYTVYSKETAEAMARACTEAYNADIVIGVTGTMGNIDPSNPDASVPGQVYFAIGVKGEIQSYYIELEPQPTRLAYKLAVAKEIYDALMKRIS